ncbi:MAG: LuxR C-terminal-related transcriptional regulator [Jatrophihabitantaceae bacterium]
MPRIAIVEDHLLLAETLRAALAQSEVSATIVPPAPLDELLSELRALQPELVLLDLDLDRFGDSTPLIAPLVDSGVRVLLVTGTTERLRIARALEQGAIGVHRKASGFVSLQAKALDALAASVALDPEERVLLLAELSRWRVIQDRELAPFRRLTDREQSTLRSLARGQTVTEIATDWVVAEATVRSHVRGVLTKLGVGSQLAAVAAAQRSGWFASERVTTQAS